jgi:acetyl esterase/lipase
LLLALIPSTLLAQATGAHAPVPVKLWPNGAPGATLPAAPESDLTTAKDGLNAGKPVMRLGNVAEPTITFYPAHGGDGTTVVVFPGGGYTILAYDLEGTEVCEWLNRAGIHCALVKYRVPDSGPYPKHAAALQDAQRAVGLIRSRAAEWKLNPHRIGVLGFSAGGHLVATLSTHFEQRVYSPVDAADQTSCRPDFAVLVYPAYLGEKDSSSLNPEIHVTASTPPAFMVETQDDPYFAESSIAYYMALKKAGVPAEMHLYANGGHGYGLRPSPLPVTHWTELVETWLHHLPEPSTH